MPPQRDHLSNMYNKRLLATQLALAGLLTACGGGGSGSDSTTPPSTPSNPTTPPVTTASVKLSGTAAKGLMANADVAVYAVNPDGSAAGTPLASTTTDANGQYTLSFTGDKGAPYIVKVSAKADGSTTHADEVSGQAQPLPAGFAMRAAVVPDATGTVTTSASITPFSEMAVAAAAKANGGLNANNVGQAVSTVTQLLGFDPTKVAAATVGTAKGADEQKLAVMLTAVSKLANTGDLGCASGSSGDKVKCVVETLAAAAKADSIKLAAGSGSAAKDVSAALSGAVTAIVSDDKFADKIDKATLVSVVANLGCTTNCTAAPGGGAGATPDPLATAIASAKLMFTQLRTDFSRLLSRGGASALASGGVNQEAAGFGTAMTDVQVPLEVLAKDLATMTMAVDLYNDYMAGRVTNPNRGRADGSLVVLGAGVNPASVSAVGCTLFADTGNVVIATRKEDVKQIGCAARYRVERSVQTNGSTLTREWRHAFTIVPASDGSFDYTARARLRETQCAPTGSCTTLSNVALQTSASDASYGMFAGKLTPTLSGSLGSITAVAVKGELPAAMGDDGKTITGFKHTIDVSGSITASGATTPGQAAKQTSSLSGSIAAVDASGKSLGALTLKSATIESWPVSWDASGREVAPDSPRAVAPAGATLAALSANVVLAKGGAEFEGTLTLDKSAWDKGGTSLSPTRAVLAGTLRNVSAASSVAFVQGRLEMGTTGWAGFDDTKPPAADNSHGMTLAFTGSVTATGRPTLELSMGTSMVNDSATARPQQATMQYRTLVAGAPRLVVAMTADRDPATGDLGKLKLTEATSNLAMTWTPTATSIDLMAGSLKVGVLDTSRWLITFADGTSTSLDFGL